jgi:uncharacterized protein YfeS
MALRVHTWSGMLTQPEKYMTDFGNAGIANLLKAVFAQRRLHRMDEQPSEGTEILAHMKVIAPLISTGPLVRAWVLEDSASMLTIRFDQIVFAGALVQIRMQGKTVFGIARRCTPKGSEYEIEIEKQEIY